MLQDGLNYGNKYQVHFAASDAGPECTDSPNHCSRSGEEAKGDLLEGAEIQSEAAKAGIQLGRGDERR